MAAATVRRSPRGRETYHHGSLRQALIDAALGIAAEEGLDKVTVRAAGERAGVSSGAPFRHFASKTALMTAVAEEAMQRFRAEIDASMAEAVELGPLERYRALGLAYLRWALGNPTHFEIISSRGLIDFENSELLVRLNREIQGLMASLLAEAQRAGELREIDLDQAALMARALVYGLARMWIDGHFAQWGGQANAETLIRWALDDYLALLAR